MSEGREVAHDRAGPGEKDMLSGHVRLGWSVIPLNRSGVAQLSVEGLGC